MSADTRFVGALPPQSFLKRFMNLDGSHPPAPLVDFSRLRVAQTVRDISEALIHAAENAQVCPNLRLFITKVKRRNLEPDSSKARSLTGGTDGSRAVVDVQNKKADLCAPLAARKQPRSTRKTKKKRGFDEYYDYATAALGFEILLSADEDPFADPEDYVLPSPIHAPPPAEVKHSKDKPTPPSHMSTTLEAKAPISFAPLASVTPASSHGGSESESEYETTFERDTPEAAVSRARLLSCAQAHFARQQRCFLFQVVIVVGQARFIRWDRAGAVVSSRFCVHQHPYLSEFLWRFAHMNDQQRGWDSTVSSASKREAALFTQAVREFLAESRRQDSRMIPEAEQSLDDTDTFPTWKIRATNADTDNHTLLLVRRPFAGHPALFGRATRAYLAYDLQQSRLVFLKDAWRAHDHRLRPEFQTYQDLRSRDVPFIPYPSFGGDVQHLDGTVQVTMSQVLASENKPWRATTKTFEGHVHHRLVQEIAYPLDTVRNERELMQTMHDALTALDRAHRELGLVHRDLSSLNIMLSHDGKCILSDWDHAGLLGQGARGVGTYQFMSLRLLNSGSNKTNEHVDDLESMFWVLLFVALLRLATRVHDLPMGFFRDPGPEQRRTYGILKTAYFDSSLYKQRFRSKAFGELVMDLASSWARYYAAIEEFGEGASQPSTNFDEDSSILELAKQPSFWIEKFASAIRKYDGEHVDTNRSKRRGPQSLFSEERGKIPAPTASSPKRKLNIPGETDEVPSKARPEDADLPRRSKRLKAMHYRS